MRWAITSSVPVCEALDPVLLDALAEDREAGVEVGGVDVGDEAGLEALSQTVFEGLEIAWWPIGGKDDLGACFVEGVEGVEELLLGACLALEELDIVDQQHVDVAEATLEDIHVPAGQGELELVGEGLAGGGAHAQAGIAALQEVGDGVQEVGLANPRRAADEERVVGLPGSSATVSAAAWASRLESPMTKCSKLNRGLPAVRSGLRRAWSGASGLDVAGSAARWRLASDGCVPVGETGGWSGWGWQWMISTVISGPRTAAAEVCRSRPKRSRIHAQERAGAST